MRELEHKREIERFGKRSSQSIVLRESRNSKKDASRRRKRDVRQSLSRWKRNVFSRNTVISLTVSP